MPARTTELPESRADAGQLILALAAQLHGRFQGDCRIIASALQWTAGAVRTLMRGGMSTRWRLLFSISKVALAVGRPRDAVAEEMVRSFLPGSCVIGHALVRTISARGLPLAVVLKQLGLSEAAFNRLLLGRTLAGLPAATRAALARFLDLDDQQVQQLIRESLTRRRMPTRDLDLVGPVRSLAEALPEAFDREGLSQTEWVKRHHFSNHWIHSLVIGHQPRTPQRSLARLAAALGWHERQVLAGLRLNQPFPPPPHAGVFERIAERIAGAGAEGAGHEVLARAFAMTRPGVERLCARQDLSRTSARTMHRIRRWLGLAWRDFVALASSRRRTPSAELRCATSFTPVEHGELVMIRLWRKAPPALRSQALQALRVQLAAPPRPGRVAEERSMAEEPRMAGGGRFSAGGRAAGGAPTATRLAPAAGMPMCELLFDACDGAQATPTRWGMRHHLSLGTVRSLLVGERVPLGTAVLDKLAGALGLTPEAVRSAIAANIPLPAPPHHAVFAALLRRNAGRPTPLIAREMAMARSTYDRMVDLGDLHRLCGMTIHRLRRWMGWSWEALVRQAHPASEELAPDVAPAAAPASEREDEEELALIRSWRRAAPGSQDKALELLTGVAI